MIDRVFYEVAMHNIGLAVSPGCRLRRKERNAQRHQEDPLGDGRQTACQHGRGRIQAPCPWPDFPQVHLQIDSKSDAGITLSSILILFIIGSLPAALALFHRYTKELRAEPDMNIKLEKYKKASIIRLLVIGLGLVAGVLFFYVLHSQSMLFCAGIAAIGLVFCKPAEVKIITDLEIEETEE